MKKKLSDNQNKIINDLIKEFEAINASNEQPTGKFIDFTSIISDITAKRKKEAEIKAINDSWYKKRREIILADIEKISSDLEKINLRAFVSSHNGGETPFLCIQINPRPQHSGHIEINYDFVYDSTYHQIVGIVVRHKPDYYEAIKTNSIEEMLPHLHNQFKLYYEISLKHK